MDQLARGLAGRGDEVEILTQGPAPSTLHGCERIVVRRFPAPPGRLRLVGSPRMWEWLWRASDTFDVVDVHTRHLPVAAAAARARVSPLVFTPGAPLEEFLRWPYTCATRAVVASAAQIVCHSELERELLCGALPRVAHRTQVVRDGVDAAALLAARPFETDDTVVLAVDRLDRTTGVRRAIAAMPSLDPAFRLVIVGDGPARDRLHAYAADLHISSRVHFAGAVSDAVLHRWLRTARVVVALAAERGSGSQVIEARAAGASVVASDLPIHREAAERPGVGHVIFVPAKGSPLDVADAIDEAARVSVLSSARGPYLEPPSWESVVHATSMLYVRLLGAEVRPMQHNGAGELAGAVAHRMNGGHKWS